MVRLRGSFHIEHTLARRGAEKLWNLLHTEDYVNCLGALTGGQAMQQVKAGVKAIYLSGWQVAADGNTSMSMYPDQSLYAVDSVPTMVERINNAFRRADEIQHSKGIDAGDKGYIDNFAPIVADAEAGAPMSHAQDVCQRLRDDTVTETDQHEKFQAIAPQVEAGLYLVPRVIE